MSGSRTTRLLVVIFVGLLAIGYLINLARQNANPQPAFPTPMPEVFPGVDQTRITRMEIEVGGRGRKITLVKTPGDWKGTDEKGARVAVNLAQVTRMLQVLSTLRYNRVMEGTDLTMFGLGGGGYFVVRFEAGQPYTLHIGDLNSAQTNAYVQRGQDPAVLQVPAGQMVILLSMVLEPVDVPS